MTDEIVKPPPSSFIAACPPWPSIFEYLDVSNVKTVSPHLFNIERKEIKISSRIWFVHIKNITATNQEEALTKAKNRVATLPPGRLKYIFTYARGCLFCLYSTDIYMSTTL